MTFSSLLIKFIAFCGLASAAAPPAAMAGTPSAQQVIGDLQKLGWSVQAAESGKFIGSKDNGTQVTFKLSDSEVADDASDQPLVLFAAATPAARAAFSDDMQLIVQDLLAERAAGSLGDGIAKDTAVHVDRRATYTTCSSSCPVGTCAYKEKTVVNIGCMNLEAQNVGIGYLVRFRTGRCGDVNNYQTGSVSRCSDCVRLYKDYFGKMRACPLCQTSTFTMLDCSFPY